MTTITITTDKPATATILMEIMMEVERAEKKHPTWPNDIIRQIAFISEESGELTRAGNLLEEGTGTFAEIRTEAIQTASTAIRLLKNLKNTAANHIQPVYIDFLTDDDHEMIRRDIEHG